MGVPKQLLAYNGCTLLRRAAQTALASRCFPVVVVIGTYENLMRWELKNLDVKIAVNANWSEGMSSSIRLGLESLEDVSSVTAAVITLCDQPFVSPQTIDELIDAYWKLRMPVVASEYAGTVGVPALFDRSLFPELAALKGANGAKQLIKKYLQRAHCVPFPSGAIDLDTREDHECLLRRTPFSKQGMSRK